MNEALKEELLMIEKAKSDPQHFEPLYRKYYQQILKFIYKRMNTLEDTYEVTSNTFSKALFSIAKYNDRGFPFSSWLHRIAINEIAQFYRDSKKNRAISIDDRSVLNLSEETGKDFNELKAALTIALGYLSVEEVQILELRFFEERSFAEVGAILNITENNAKVRTYRVIDKLKASFNKLT